MPDAGEAAELRALQGRAYRRNGGLTEAESERLHELEARRRGAPAPASLPVVEQARLDGGPSSAPHRTPPPSPVLDRSTRDDDASDAERSGQDENPRHAVETSPGILLRRFWRRLAIAAVLLVAVGLGIGWLAFGRSAFDEITLTGEQRGWQADIAAKGTFDAGSLRPVAVKDDVVVWAATREEGKMLCLVMGADGESIQSCNSVKMAREQGLYGTFAKGETETQSLAVNAQMLFSASGQPAVAVSSFRTSRDTGVVYANEEEAAIAAALADQGYIENSIWVIGYDEATPIWTAQQEASGKTCLVYGGSEPDPPVDCRMWNGDEAERLELNVIDAATGALTTLSYGPMNGGPPYLQLTKGAE